MNRTEFLAATVSMARAGIGFNPAAALDCLAAMVAEEDPTNPLYESRAERLLRVAACIWSLRHDKYLGSSSHAAPGELS